MSSVRGIRGATTADSNSNDAVVEATGKLLRDLVDQNDIDLGDVAAAIFTTTDDLDTKFPASVARQQLGWEYVALIDAQQVSVRGGLPLCIRVLLLVNTDKAPQDLKNVYLKQAANLREGDEEV